MRYFGCDIIAKIPIQKYIQFSVKSIGYCETKCYLKKKATPKISGKANEYTSVRSYKAKEEVFVKGSVPLNGKTSCFDGH